MKKEIVLKKLRTLSEERLQTWLKNLPDDEMIEAFQILNNFIKSIPLYKTDSELRKKVAESEANLERFKDAVLQEKAEELMHEIKIDAQIKKTNESYERVRTKFFKAIAQNPKKIEELKRIAFA